MNFGGFFNPKNGKNPTAQNPGSNPVLNQVMNATGGATHAFNGISRHVNASLKKMGAKNIEAGLGCGVGFGAGLALKPGVVHQFQLYLVQSMGKMMTKFGVSHSFGQSILPTTMVSRTSSTNQIPSPNPAVNMMQYVSANNPIQRLIKDKKLSNRFLNESDQSQDNSNRTEKVQNPVLQDDSKLNEIDGNEQLESENRMLHMVLKHEQVIEELKEENEKIRRILVEDLKISPNKFHSKYSTQSNSRKQRRK